MRAYERDPNDDDLDTSSLFCPRCGCNAVVILQYPKDAKSWWGRIGKAKCDFCGIVFPIRMDEDQ